MTIVCLCIQTYQTDEQRQALTRHVACGSREQRRQSAGTDA